MFINQKTPKPFHLSTKALSTISFVRTIIAALLVACLFNATISFMYVSSGSMLPTLKVGATICAQKLNADAPINRGDIVIFSPYTDDNAWMDLDEDKSLYIKRIIGLPGDTVEIKGGKLYLNDAILDEPYLPDGVVMFDFNRVTVPENCYFMMGDNRNASNDSRIIGAIPRENIVMKSIFSVPTLTSFRLERAQANF